MLDAYSFRQAKLVTTKTQELQVQIARAFREEMIPFLHLKAFFKLEEKFYLPKEGRYLRRDRTSKWGFYINKSTPLWFSVFHDDVRDYSGRRVEATFQVSERSIPAVYRGLNKFIREEERFREPPEFTFYNFDAFVSGNFCHEYSPHEFQERMSAFADFLRSIASQCDEIAQRQVTKIEDAFLSESKNSTH